MSEPDKRRYDDWMIEEAARKRALLFVNCYWCGVQFKPRNKHHHYCGRICRKLARSDRRNAARRKRYATDAAYRAKELKRRNALFMKQRVLVPHCGEDEKSCTCPPMPRRKSPPEP